MPSQRRSSQTGSPSTRPARERDANASATLVVAIQFVAAGGIVVGGPIWPLGWIARAFLVASVLLLVWSVWVMKPGRFNVRPIPHRRAELVTSGPYRWIRHPMYLSVLVFFGVFAAAHPTPLRIGLWLALLIDILVKIRIEERLLAERLQGYGDYAKRTRRLVPWVF